MAERAHRPILAGVILGLAVAALLVFAYLMDVMPVERGTLADSDCYVHLLRAEKLWRSGRWYDSVLDRSNAPYGDELHWTRPFDVLLLLGAVPASLFVEFRDALFWWGVAISPLLLVATVVVFRWAMAPLVNRDALSLASVFVVIQLGVLAAFLPARPDHHSLLVFLFVALTGFVLRLLEEPGGNLRLGYGAGVVGALCMWASVELLAPVAIAMGVLAVCWVLYGRDFDKKSLHYSLALASVTAIALFVERPLGTIGALELDRLSVVYTSIFALIASLWGLVRIADSRRHCFERRANRLWGLVIAAGLVVLFVGLFFPKLYHSPLGNVDASVVEVYVQRVAEMEALLTGRSRFSGGIPLVGAAAICLPFLLIRSIRHAKRVRWAYIGLSTAVFTGLTLLQKRWLAYPQVLLAVALAELLSTHVVKPHEGRIRWPRALANVVVVTVTCFFLSFSGVLFIAVLRARAPERSGPEEGLDVPWRQMCDYLNHAGRWQGRQVRILANTFGGGEILYRTPHEVIATPYHRNTQGILDTHNVMMAKEDSQALELVRRRAVDLIILSPPRYGSAPDAAPDEDDVFHERLRAGKAPDWCIEVDLPEELSSSFHLFEIAEPKAAGQDAD